MLDKKFFLRPATEVAPDLLGKLLCRKTEKGVKKYRICETECYYGEDDTACHAHKGRTPRTETLYLEGGHLYVYLCYGIHSLINVVTGPEGVPQGCLIRGVEGIAGPGRVTSALGIDREFNRMCVTIPECEGGLLWFEDDGYRPEYFTAPRIGIDYAKKEDIERHWRFEVKYGYRNRK